MSDAHAAMDAFLRGQAGAPVAEPAEPAPAGDPSFGIGGSVGIYMFNSRPDPDRVADNWIRNADHGDRLNVTIR